MKRTNTVEKFIAKGDDDVIETANAIPLGLEANVQKASKHTHYAIG